MVQDKCRRRSLSEICCEGDVVEQFMGVCFDFTYVYKFLHITLHTKN